MFNAAHLHLIVNHFPVVGFIVAFMLAVFGLFIRDRMLNLTAWAVTVGSALTGVFAYLTGDGADEMIDGTSGLSDSYLSAHMRWGDWTYYASIGIGIIALAGWIWSRRRVDGSRMAMGILTAIMVVACAMVTVTASLGGGIRHPEEHADQFEVLIRDIGMIPDEQEMYDAEPKWKPAASDESGGRDEAGDGGDKAKPDVD